MSFGFGRSVILYPAGFLSSLSSISLHRATHSSPNVNIMASNQFLDLTLLLTAQRAGIISIERAFTIIACHVTPLLTIGARRFYPSIKHEPEMIRPGQ